MRIGKLAGRLINILQEEGLLALVMRIASNVSLPISFKNKITRLITIVRYMAQRFTLNAPAHPYTIILVNPEDIENEIAQDATQDKIRLAYGLGQIIDGDWDISEIYCNPISKLDTYIGLKQHFEEGYAWEDTDYVKDYKDLISEKYGYYRSVDEFIRVRCAHVDSLYRKIRDEGYRANKDGIHTVPGQEIYKSKN